jgi:hypothetical protein
VRAFSRIEGFEYVGQIIGGNAGAVVRDSHHDVAVLSGRGYLVSSPYDCVYRFLTL